MAKNIKARLYSKLILINENVFEHTDEGNPMPRDVKYPLITYYRLGEKQMRTGERREQYQVTARSAKVSEIETIKSQFQAIFANSKFEGYKCSTDVGPDIYDQEAKVKGVPITLQLRTVDHEN